MVNRRPHEAKILGEEGGACSAVWGGQVNTADEGRRRLGEALAQTQLRRGKALAEKKSAQSDGIGADLCAVIFTIGW